MPVRPPALEHEILDLEPELARAWAARFTDVDPAPTVPALVVRELLTSILTSDSTDLTDAARALGVLRSLEGRHVSALVEDLLALRTTVWGSLATTAAVVDDPGAAVMLHQRTVDAADTALRAAVEAYVEESQRVLSRRATRDPLTGVLNRAAFDEAVTREVVARSDPPSMLLIDLDRFKQVNDGLGHLAGDRVLVSVAALVVDACRAGDVVGRLGGDEFAVLLPATRPDDAQRVAERILAATQRSTALDPVGAEPVRLSIGLGWCARPATIDELVEAADAAMYDAKRAGGARVARRVVPASVAQDPR